MDVREDAHVNLPNQIDGRSHRCPTSPSSQLAPKYPSTYKESDTHENGRTLTSRHDTAGATVNGACAQRASAVAFTDVPFPPPWMYAIYRCAAYVAKALVDSCRRAVVSGRM